MVKQPEPKYDMIDDYVSFLYEAVSDVEGLVSQTSSDQGMTDDHHPIVDLKVLIAKIAHNLRKFPLCSNMASETELDRTTWRRFYPTRSQ